MLFEPTEKRLEVHWRQPHARFTAATFVERLLSAAKATILTKLEHKDATAYILAESSLFVWPHKMLLITCGQTVLYKAAEWVQKNYSSDIAMLSFSREKDLFPDAQITLFGADEKHLKEFGPCELFHVKNVNTSHDYLLASPFAIESPHRQTTRYVFNFAQKKLPHTSTGAALQKAFGIEKFFKKFKFDEHVFSPWGYSANGILGQEYLTLHVSLVKETCYVTFESNSQSLCPPELMAHWNKHFQPAHVAVIKHDSSGRPTAATIHSQKLFHRQKISPAKAS
jgi:S-adenosylmethionine decarboxylase